MIFKNEQDLAPPVARYLKNRAFRQQKLEVQFYEHRIDMYGYSSRDDLTVAVELKLYKWLRAVEQAILYQLCSDLVYIAMPQNSIARIDLKIITECRLGLLSVEEGRCREIIPPVSSPVLRKHYREEYLALLQGRS